MKTKEREEKKRKKKESIKDEKSTFANNSVTLIYLRI